MPNKTRPSHFHDIKADRFRIADHPEVRQIAQLALDSVRSLSQALHPVMLDEAGLEATIDWYLPAVQRQTGVTILYEKQGQPFEVGASAAVQIYRVLQEALNNLTRHSGAREAWVRLRFLPEGLEAEVEDHGAGMSAPKGNQGIGLVAMRERAELLRGKLELTQPAEGGTLVRLKVPKESLTAHAG